MAAANWLAASGPRILQLSMPLPAIDARLLSTPCMFCCRLIVASRGGRWALTLLRCSLQGNWSLRRNMRHARLPELQSPVLCAWQAKLPTCSVQQELYMPSGRPRGQWFALVYRLAALSPQPLLVVGSPAVSSSTPAPIWPCECPLDRVLLGMAKAGKATTIGNCNMSAPQRRAELPRICRVPPALNRSPEVL